MWKNGFHDLRSKKNKNEKPDHQSGFFYGFFLFYALIFRINQEI